AAYPYCDGAELYGAEIFDYILDPVNNERTNLVDGTQKNGNSGQNLPPAKGMTRLDWDCDLEREAIKTVNSACFDYVDEPPVTKNQAQVYLVSYADGLPNSPVVMETLFKQTLAEIDNNALAGVTPGASQVIYKPDIVENLLNYFTLMRPTNTRIGCAWRKCTNVDGDDMINVYCRLNSQQLKDGDVIYNVGTAGVCSDCPTGTSCDRFTKLCVSATSVPTTSPAPTTKTTSPPAPTTTPPTSPEANFPSGASSRCSHPLASRMTDTLRSEYERMHNFRRGLLATGQIPRKDGKYLPTASNMQKIVYDCGLEEGAIQYAGTCPTRLSELSSRPMVGENFRTFDATRFNFDTAAKKSVTEWWKVIRDVNYFEKVVVFRPFHDGAPISSFTQMAWATSSRVGCSIVNCSTSNRYVGVCRYSDRGNIVNNNVYEVGPVCSACPSGKPSCNG
ncbi:SCP-like protein, partial [Ancylostoma duodenale]